MKSNMYTHFLMQMCTKPQVFVHLHLTYLSESQHTIISNVVF